MAHEQTLYQTVSLSVLLHSFFLSIDYVVSLRKRQQSIETGNIYSSLKDIVECCLVSIAFVGPITEYFMLHLCNHSLQGNIVLSND